MKFSQRIENLKPSMTLEINAVARELQAKGEDVIGFGAGEPDFDTPEHIKQAAIRALEANDTHYTPVGGTPALKAAIVEKLRRDNHLNYNPDQIVVSCGAKHSIFNLAQVLWEPGDEVIVPAPYWVSYPDIIGLTGAVPVIVPTRDASEFKIVPEQIDEAVTPKTRALVLNSPSNPTGSAYTRKELEAIAECALKNNLLIVSDEIYDLIVFDGFEQVSIASLSPEVQAQTVVINGVSKGYAMTGWRIGYLAADKRIVAQIQKYQGQSTSNPTSISQAASVEALTGPQDAVQKMVEEFRERRDLILECQSRIPGVSCYRPVGAFYTFPNFSELYEKKYEGKPLAGSLEFAKFLLKEAKVAVVPGVAFGADANARLSFATSREKIQEGLTRIENAVRSL